MSEHDHRQVGVEGRPEAPAGLATDLRAMYRVPIEIAPGADQAVLALARQRAAAVASRRVMIRRLTRWGLVAAAGLAVGVSLVARLGWHGRATGANAALAEDVNGDGAVDILDALALERAVERGSAAKAWDLDGDGVVDRADVDRVAMAAVRLTPRAGGNG
jgi:Dockerin type I domain